MYFKRDDFKYNTYIPVKTIYKTQTTFITHRTSKPHVTKYVGDLDKH